MDQLETLVMMRTPPGIKIAEDENMFVLSYSGNFTFGIHIDRGDVGLIPTGSSLLIHFYIYASAQQNM